MAEAAEFQGTPSAPARRWFRRTAALLAGVPLLAGVLQLPAAPAARATGPQPAAAPSGSRTVDVDITGLTPTTPSENDTLTITGTVTNNGRSTVSGASVALRVGPPMNSRTAIEDAAERKGYDSSRDGLEIGGKYARKVGKLRAGVSRDFTLSVPVKELRLNQPGAYLIGVALSGESGSEPWPHVLGIERTFLPWQPSGAPKKTRLTYLWPLISTSHLMARTEADEQQTPIFRDDTLRADLAPGGRLQQMVALGKDLPVTWVIDPDLLASAHAMTEDYLIEKEDGSTEEGEGQADARQWLGELQKAVQGHQVVALPFADPDLASLAHRGTKVSGALSHLQSATRLSATTVESILGVKPRTDFAWPVDGAIDRSIVGVATSAGAHNIIARGDSLRETGDLLYTPTAARQIGGGNTAIVADARLSTVFSGDMTRAENATPAVQRFLAQSQMLTMQAPDKQRSIVVAPQRMPTTSQAQAMAAALGGLQGGRWTQPSTLGDAAKAKPDPGATRKVPGDRAYRTALRRHELPTGAFEEIQKTQVALNRFKVILTAKERVVTPFGTAIMREMSTSWRADATGATDYRRSINAYLKELSGKVRLIPKTKVTLSGRSATIPVTVQNGLAQDVKGLTLSLKSSQPIRLQVSDAQTIDIERGHSQSLKFGTTAKANGRVFVTAQLITADGQPYGEEMPFEVNVTEATSTVILVIAGGVLLLVLAGIRIYVQRKRAGHDGDSDENNKTDMTDGSKAADEDERADESGGPNAVVPEQPSDPTPDTGSQNAEPSGSGEKVDH
ncbi:DUF6049 family protein [Streptomyces sp. LX-29]|uniref:DUF6049 family protein n=1 Tax=Streptomyces sp. LX-29 TaxID=2900152 RepID=UPI00240CEFA1|nr:DUF6049 family protein [Streptomyces sp. LX-29]WFB08458.1 DUF6049 family protein [Streptomyces sp. LX-29]